MFRTVAQRHLQSGNRRSHNQPVAITVSSPATGSQGDGKPLPAFWQPRHQRCVFAGPNWNHGGAGTDVKSKVETFETHFGKVKSQTIPCDSSIQLEDVSQPLSLKWMLDGIVQWLEVDSIWVETGLILYSQSRNLPAAWQSQH